MSRTISKKAGGFCVGLLAYCYPGLYAEECVKQSVTASTDVPEAVGFDEPVGLDWSSTKDTKCLELTINGPTVGNVVQRIVNTQVVQEGIMWTNDDQKKCQEKHVWKSGAVKPQDQFRTLFKGTFCGGGGEPVEWKAGVIMADVSADADNDSTDAQRPPKTGDKQNPDEEKADEEVAEQASGSTSPGLILCVNRGFEEGGKGECKEDFEKAGIKKNDPDLVRGSLVFKLPEGVSATASLTYVEGGEDKRRINVYLLVGEDAALIASGSLFEVGDKPEIAGGGVVKFGPENKLLLEGMKASESIKKDKILVTLHPEKGKETKDELFFTVIDVRLIRDTKAAKVLEVSKFVTTEKLDGTDPDNFRVEVEDATITQSEGNTIPKEKVKLEALKATGGSFDPPRTLNVVLTRVTEKGGGSTHLFRSAFLRLVVDEKDKESKPDQTLRTDTDIKDDGTGDATIEILGQDVRVAYLKKERDKKPVIKCQAIAGVCDVRQCTQSTTEDDARRVKLTVFILGAKITPAAAQRGILRWLRRAYAQICLAPPPTAELDNIKVLEPKSFSQIIAVSDLESFGEGGGVPEQKARGKTIAGQASSITILLKNVRPNKIELPVTAGKTPREVADQIRDILNQAPFNAAAESFTNAMSTTDNTAASFVPSADVLAKGVELAEVRSSDAVLKVGIGKVEELVTPHLNVNVFTGSRSIRTILRNKPTSDDKISVFAIRRFKRTEVGGPPGNPFIDARIIDTEGLAMLTGLFMREEPGRSWRGQPGIRNAVFVDADTLATDSKHFPFVLAHEIGHILLDDNHTDVANQIMIGVASERNSVRANKRIAGSPTPFAFPLPRGTAPGRPNAVVQLLQPNTIRTRFPSLIGNF